MTVQLAYTQAYGQRLQLFIAIGWQELDYTIIHIHHQQTLQRRQSSLLTRLSLPCSGSQLAKLCLATICKP